MRRTPLVVCACLLLSCAVRVAQGKQQGVEHRAHLALSAEVATTTDKDCPSTLRITLRNAGNVSVDLPVAPEACEPDGGIEIEMEWTPNRPGGTGKGWGHGCGTGDLPPLRDRVRNRYVRLRPGEYFVFTKELPYGLDGLKDGTIEYWVQFTPPKATAAEVDELLKEGYVIPTEKLETPHLSFPIY